MHPTPVSILTLWLVVLNLHCYAQQTADQGANAKTKQILAYITDLPKQGMLMFQIDQLID